MAVAWDVSCEGALSGLNAQIVVGPITLTWLFVMWLTRLMAGIK